MLKGLPCSGKTEWARRWADADPTHRVRLSWTETMRQLGRHTRHRRLIAFEGCIHMMQQALSLGLDVCIDEENLDAALWTPFQARAQRACARTEWHTMKATADECKKRAVAACPDDDSLKRAIIDIGYKADIYERWLKK